MSSRFNPATGRVEASFAFNRINVPKPHFQRYPIEAVYAPENMPGALRSALQGARRVTTLPKAQMPPPGTVLPNGLVMGEFGPYHPKIRKLQQLFNEGKEGYVWLKRPTDRVFMMAAYSMVAVTCVGIVYNAASLFFGKPLETMLDKKE